MAQAASQQHEVDNQPLVKFTRFLFMGIFKQCSFWQRNFPHVLVHVTHHLERGVLNETLFHALHKYVDCELYVH